MSLTAWQESPACIATYRILENDKLFDAFDEDGLPFADAGAATIGHLLLFFGTGHETELRAKSYAKTFLNAFRKLYLSDSKLSRQQYTQAFVGLSEVFTNKDSTLLAIAGVVHAAFYNGDSE
ncbi:hypothetical protein [Microbulbifer discodermiae]|uniref:hypothetical protein n=1 Tax=Microbulbifer sp. 2201CG32-9 TaxID=3232309 RepID=UPI00345C29B9